MIAFVRTANIAPGKAATAVAFATEVRTLIQKKYDVAAEVLRPVGGNPARVAWSLRFKDLAAMEAFMGKLAADATYQELAARSFDCFLPASVNDAIWTCA